MGKLLGLQKHFTRVIVDRLYVAIPSIANVTGKGKSAVDCLFHMEKIPSKIADHHESVRAGFLVGAVAETLGSKVKKRAPAFSKKEFPALKEILLKFDCAITPLEQVHAHIASLDLDADVAGLVLGSGKSVSSTTKKRRKKVVRRRVKKVVKKSARKSEEKSESLLCPKCGAVMVRRVAKKGERAGKEFLGCSGYPKCHSIVNLD